MNPTLKTWIKGSFCLPEQSVGAGATADYDNDGLLDIYYARVDGNDQLWRNIGDGSFQLVTTEAESYSNDVPSIVQRNLGRC